MTETAPRGAGSLDAGQLAATLTGILDAILAAKGGAPDDRDLGSATFTSLDFNSVDYLEFVLNVEAELNLDIPDEAVLDPSLSSARAWAEWIEGHADELATPAIGRGA